MTPRICLLLCALAILGCDTVSHRYPTLDDARKDRLFERGWLPDILPPSAKNLHTENNLDINTSEGEFYFALGDYQLFQGRLQPYASLKSSYSDLEGFVRRKTKEGYVAGQYTSSGSVWVFLGSDAKTHCVYRMWSL